MKTNQKVISNKAVIILVVAILVVTTSICIADQIRKKKMNDLREEIRATYATEEDIEAVRNWEPTGNGISLAKALQSFSGGNGQWYAMGQGVIYDNEGLNHYCHMTILAPHDTTNYTIKYIEIDDVYYETKEGIEHALKEIFTSGR